MLKYITVDEYKKLLGVQSIPDDFDKLLIDVSIYINSKTFNRIDMDNIPEEVKYVTALIIEETNKTNNTLKEIGNLKSQNIEGWSETYQEPKTIIEELENKKIKIIHNYLWNVIGKDGNTLLYCGVG